MNNQKIASFITVMKTVSLIVAIICICTVIFALYVGDLPESNVGIRYAEIGTFLFVLPFIIKYLYESIQKTYEIIRNRLEEYLATTIVSVLVYICVVIL